MQFLSTPTRRRNTKSVSQAGAVTAMESRVLLAGNVSASLSSAGTLTINGDSNNNSIDVIGLGDEIIVSEDAGGSVNGSNDIVFSAAQVKNIVINGLAGNDDVRVTDVDIPGYLTSNLALGQNALTVTGTTVGGKLTAKSSLGNDTVDLNLTEVNGATYIFTDGGSDQINFQDFLGHGKVDVITGSGDDYVEVLSGASTFDQAFNVLNKIGSDSVIFGEGTTFDGAVSVKAGAGADKVESSLSTFNGKVSVNLGAGADEITVTGNTFNQAVTLDGGTNQDILFNDDTNIFAFNPIIKRIETIIL